MTFKTDLTDEEKRTAFRQALQQLYMQRFEAKLLLVATEASGDTDAASTERGKMRRLTLAIGALQNQFADYMEDGENGRQ